MQLIIIKFCLTWMGVRFNGYHNMKSPAMLCKGHSELLLDSFTWSHDLLAMITCRSMSK